MRAHGVCSHAVEHAKHGGSSVARTGNQPGQEIEFPMAVVILGGLVTSTLLNLFVLPALYLRFGAGTAHGPEIVMTPQLAGTAD